MVLKKKRKANTPVTQQINWSLFTRLLVTCLVATFFVLPYTVAISPTIAAILTPIVIAAQIVQSGILFAISIYVGLRLTKKVGFKLPILEGKNPFAHVREILPISLWMGFLGGVLILLFSILFGSLSLTFLRVEMSIALWKRALASFYGGVAEEVLFRLFLMTVLVWVSTKVARTKNGYPTTIGIWISIVVTTVLFGLGHLGITGGVTAITDVVILRAVLLNGISVIFCWLYWKKGLESAMIAHFTADIIIHVLAPFAAGYFL